MCYFDKLDPAGFFGQIVQIVFLAAACSVDYLGFVLSILVFGLLPAYVYGYFVYTKRSRIVTLAGKLHATVAAIMTLSLSSVLWISAMVIGMWG